LLVGIISVAASLIEVAMTGSSRQGGVDALAVLDAAAAALGQVSFSEPSARRRITLSPVLLFHTYQLRPQYRCVLADVVYVLPLPV